jgi:hypothetical protein
MVQLGQNAGQRNARAYGFVNNIKRKIAPSEKDAKDLRILGAISLYWNIFKSRAPKEVVDKAIDSIKKSKMAEMGTAGIQGTINFY